MTRKAGRRIGCGIALILGILALVLAGPTLFFVAMFMIGAQPHIFQRVSSPDGRSTAVLGRPGGSMEPKYYWVRIDSGWFGRHHCDLADIEGLDAASFVRMQWRTPDTVTIRYGVAPGLRPPRPARGAGVCTTVRVTFVADPTLDAAAARRNTDLDPPMSNDATEALANETPAAR